MLPKKLFAQVTDFARLKGRRMSPEQTETALKRLQESSFSPSGWEKRGEFIDQLKQTGLLEDPNIERAYAIGSSVTPKVDPTDLDILYRGRTSQNTLRAAEAITPQDTENIHALVPQMEESYGTGMRMKPQEAFNASAASSAAAIAKVGVGRHGESHRWIRLVSIPAAVGLGLMSQDEADAAFKPLEVAKTTAKLLKQQSKNIETKGGRLGKVVESMLKVPQSEYSRIQGVETFPRVKMLSHGELRGAYIHDNPFHPSLQKKVVLSSSDVDSTTFPHEMVHSRQYSKEGTLRFLDDLQKHVEKWLKDPLAAYIDDPKEIHARAVGEAVAASNQGFTKTMYDELYNNELHKAIQYTEKWLKHLDPTFKARFLKNVAIGGTVATALMLGPLEEEAQAGPLGKAIASGEKQFFRITDRLRPFSRSLSRQRSELLPSEPKGVYFSVNAKDLPQLINPNSTIGLQPELNSSSVNRLYRAKATQGSRVLDASDSTKWLEILEDFVDKHPKYRDQIAMNIPGMNYSSNEFSYAKNSAAGNKFTDWLREKYDIVVMPDMVEAQTDLKQVVVLNPKKILAKEVGPSGIAGWKLIGASGAAIGASQLGDETTASAMPRGVYQAIDWGAQLWRKSQDAKKLIGRTLDKGKVVEDVIVTGHNERRIRFTDGTESVVTRKDIADLYRSFGTKDKEAEFALKRDNPESQITQALKSLAYHEARYQPARSEKEVISYVDTYLKNLSEMGKSISPDMVFVLRNEKLFTMPRLYAELLQSQGLLKIVKK